MALPKANESRRRSISRAMAQFPAVGELHLFLGEVELQFQQGGQVQQPVAQRRESRRIAAAHLVRGQRVGGLRRGGDEVPDGFRLREVQLAGQVGADGELARRCHACPGGDEQPQDFGDDVGGAVAGDLDRIFARIGVRGAEDGGQHVVHRAISVRDTAVVHRISGRFGERRPAPEEGVAECQRPCAADADDGDGAARGGRRGDDGIVVGGHARMSFNGPRCGAAVRCGVCGRS